MTVAFTCEDALSGPSYCPENQVLTGEGDAVSSWAYVAWDAAGNASERSNVVVARIDKTAPKLLPTAPQRLLLHAVASAHANGSDGLSGIAAQACTPLSTATVGSRWATCRVVDAAGNAATASTGYRVVYGFGGFEAPVRNGTVWNEMQNRRSIPFIWRVHDVNGNGVTSMTDVRILRRTVARSVNRLEPVLPLASYGGADPRLRNLGGGRYQRDYGVLAAHGTCAEIGIDLGDGEVHTAKFKIE